MSALVSDHYGSTFDMTGEYGNFQISELFSLFKKDQQIHLRYPAYLKKPSGTTGDDYITVQIVGEDKQTYGQLLVKSDAESGYVYNVIPTDEDGQNKSEAMVISDDPDNYNPEIFQTILVRVDPKDAKLDLAQAGDRVYLRVTYHAVKIPTIDAKSIADVTQDYDGMGPRYSPGLMKKVLDREGLIKKLRDDRYFEKPCVKARKKSQRARIRNRSRRGRMELN